RLDQGDGILSVLLSHLQTADVAAHLLRNSQARRVVAGAVDAQTRRELLNRLLYACLVDGQLAMGVHRHDVVDNAHVSSSLMNMECRSYRPFCAAHSADLARVLHLLPRRAGLLADRQSRADAFTLVIVRPCEVL